MRSAVFLSAVLATATAIPTFGQLIHHFNPFGSYAPPVKNDCVYSDWTQWSPCSGACETPGFSSRSRVILEEASNYGEACDTSSLEEWRDCIGETCSRDCVMSDWQGWNRCDADCGPGHRHRTRSVVSDAVGDGAACGFVDEVEDCNNGACARDCVEESWSAWSRCSADCGPGQRNRVRAILSDAVGAGLPCGAQSEQEFCNNGPCGQDCRQTEWSAWSACHTQSGSSCGPGKRDRSRSVIAQSSGNGLACGPNQEWEPCDNGPCGQDCRQSSWSSWSVCHTQSGSNCGPGKRDRSRSIISNSFGGGLQCGPNQEWEACDNGPCGQDCRQTEWSSWSACHTLDGSNCGPGKRDRSRSIISNAFGGGLPCGASQEWESCDNGPCTRDCEVGFWGGWSRCSADCGPGQRSRERGVVQEALGGGRGCDGLSESEFCNNGPCAVHCEQSEWSEWSFCRSSSGESCGAGRRDRRRFVTVQPSGGGQQCGPNEAWEACDLGPCVQDCLEGSWSAWSQCDSDCGPGQRDRSRPIITQPSVGGVPCGAVKEWEDCDNGPCDNCNCPAWVEWNRARQNQLFSRKRIANPPTFPKPFRPKPTGILTFG